MKTYDEIVSAELFSYTRVNPEFTAVNPTSIRESFNVMHEPDMEEMIAYAAKVSNPSSANQTNMQNSNRLIRYLIEHSHWSPLEMADATVIFNTTRDISHQVIRHRSFTFQEYSQRYAEALTDDDQAIEFVLSEARLQDQKNRQNSVPTDDLDLQDWWKSAQRGIAKYAEEVYKEAIRKGLAKEVARKVLPEGLTTTRAFMKGSLRSWVHYIDLRSANGTQKEHMQLARVIADAVQKCFPMMEEFRHV